MKKIIALILAVCMLCCFAGCGAKEDNKLVMGTNAAFPPYEFVDDNNNIVGIDAEIAAKLAEKLTAKHIENARASIMQVCK